MRSLRLMVLAMAATALLGAPARADWLSGQKPVVIVGDSFHYVPRAWAVYTIHELASDTTSRIYFAIQKRVPERKAIWLEFQVTSAGLPSVTTRILAEELPDGPGRALEAIVQVEGYDPFIVPKRYLKKEHAQVGRFEKFTAPPGIETKKMHWLGRELDVLRVETVDDRGQPYKAVICPDIPPLGVVFFNGPETEMRLEDWGGGAHSLIKGKPVGMIRWLWRQMLREGAAAPSVPVE